MPARKLTYTTLAERLKCSLGAVRSLVTGEVVTLKARIESLQAELAKLEATAASHRADFERERDRADRLLTELLKANANTTGAMAAKLEGKIAAMRLAAEAGAGTVSGCEANDQSDYKLHWPIREPEV
jgi:chromosome segregation ATPase